MKDFDEVIGRVARDAEPVPEVPREEMWAAIVSLREDERQDTATATTTAELTDIEAARAKAKARANSSRSLTWMKIAAPLAAMLVIGIGVGRMWNGSPDSAASPGQTAAVNADSGARVAANEPASPADSTPVPNDNLLNGRDVNAPADNQAPMLARSVSRGNNSNTRPSADNGSSSTRENATYDRALPYRLAAARHMSRAETLLVSMGNDIRDGHINEVAVRAADLLVNTRLLKDSPAAAEPEAQKLLDDLELILAQVATISPTRSAEDLKLIQDAINQRGVLIRLRAATAGPRLSGT